MNVFIYNYEEVKEFWEYTEKRHNSIISTREDYVNKILKKFNLKKMYHYKYLCNYYDRYIKEKGRI